MPSSTSFLLNLATTATQRISTSACGPHTLTLALARQQRRMKTKSQWAISHRPLSSLRSLLQQCPIRHELTACVLMYAHVSTRIQNSGDMAKDMSYSLLPSDTLPNHLQETYLPVYEVERLYMKALMKCYIYFHYLIPVFEPVHLK